MCSAATVFTVATPALVLADAAAAALFAHGPLSQVAAQVLAALCAVCLSLSPSHPPPPFLPPSRALSPIYTLSHIHTQTVDLEVMQTLV